MINTERLSLVPFSAKHYSAIFNNDNKLLADLLNVSPISGWTEFDEAQAAIQSLFEIFQSLENDWRWGSYFIILKSKNTLVGTAGFKGKPDSLNYVEIGYEINSKFQGLGLATETVRALVDFALLNKVDKIMAHTLPLENSSTNVLRKCHFEFSKEVVDPEDGNIWQWIWVNS
jgi:RimJ/RimL family protein N-acetyltransferase